MCMLAAKQNQKFPLHFLSAPPTPPAEENKKGKENFWVLLPRPQGADEARRLVRLLFKIGSSKAEQYSKNTVYKIDAFRHLFCVFARRSHVFLLRKTDESEPDNFMSDGK